MQENKEYHRTGITEAIAEDAIHIMEGDEAIIHDPPESHRLSKTQHTFLTVRNIFVVIAGGLFILSMLHIEPVLSLLEHTEIRGVYTGRRGIRPRKL